MPSAKEIIAKLELRPLPEEGGYYRETYRADMPPLPAASYGITAQTTRVASTGIYYLITPASFSALHRVRSDEMFHFYGGDPVEMLQINEEGKAFHFTLGSDVLAGQCPQVVVRRGCWQGVRLRAGGQWALLGATVAPGFEFEDFEIRPRDVLLREFPHLQADIVAFTRAAHETAHPNA